MNHATFIIILLLGISVEAQTTWYVDDLPTNGDGSLGNPFNSISAGLDVAQPGDIITINFGVYDLTADLRTVRNGEEASRITVKGADVNNRPVIRRTGRVLLIQHTYHTFENLILVGNFGGSDVVNLSSAHAAIIRNCEVKNTTRDGIDLNASDDVLIESCEIHHCLNGTFNNQSDGHGIVATSQKNLNIEHTEIYYCSGDCFQTDPNRNEPLWDSTFITNCHFWTGPLPSAAAGFNAGESPGENAIDTKIRDESPLSYRPLLKVEGLETHGFTNNGFISWRTPFVIKERVRCILENILVYDNQLGFRLRGDTRNGSAHVTIINCIAYDNEILVRPEDQIEILEFYNCTFDVKSSETYFNTGGGGYDPSGFDAKNCLLINSIPVDFSGPSNILANDSFFIDIDVHDYHLNCGAIPVDAGIDLLQVTQDFEGTDRNPGSYDIGADELSGDIGVSSWDGQGVNNFWSTTNNWQNNAIPRECSSVLLEDPFQVDLDINTKIRTLELQLGASFTAPLGIELIIVGL